MSEHLSSWFVYLMPLADCSAFKVGFSCDPLARIYTFSHRYYERFDLGQSSLLALATSDKAREVEATLKTELAAFRVDAPDWIPAEAGGHTEWFSAVYLPDAQMRLRSLAEAHDSAQLEETMTFIRGALERRALSFEPWAVNQAHQVATPSRDAAARAIAIRVLRDWLDAYRYFDLPLFADDPEVRAFVSLAARTVSAA